MKKIVLGALVAIGAAVALSAPAAAYVDCNGSDCWHTDQRYEARGVTIEHHPDDWYFHQHWDHDRHWHDYHEGRGYWRSGVWVTL
jgi:hypothetical protein